MANEVTIIVRARNETKPVMEQVREDMRRSGEDSGEKFTEGVDEKTKELPKVFDKHGEESGKSFLRTLLDKLHPMSEKMHGSGQEAGEGFLRGFREKLARLGDEIKSGVGDKLGGIGKMIGKLPVWAQLGAALSPAIGGAIAAALPLAIGGSVLAGGIALVAKSPAVKDAFSKLKDQLFDQDTSKIEDKIKKANERLAKAQALGHAGGIKSAQYDLEKAKADLDKAVNFNKANESLRDMAKVFEGPLVRAAGTFANTVKDLKPDIKDLFDTMAPVVTMLANGFSGFAKEIIPGIKDAVKASVPLFKTLGDHLPKIGKALSDMFSEIAKGGPDANTFFGDLLTLIEKLLPIIGDLVTGLAHVYAAIRNAFKNSMPFIALFVDGTLRAFQSVLHAAVIAFGWVPGLGSKLKTAESQFTNFRAHVNAEMNKIKDKTVKINVNTAAGIKALNTIRQSLANLDGSVANVYVRGTATGIAGLGGHALKASGGITGMARGGMVGGGLTWVGENGPELASLPTGSTVHSSGDSARMLREMYRDAGAGASGPGMLRISVDPGIEHTLVGVLLNSLRLAVANQGGNVQTVLGRSY